MIDALLKLLRYVSLIRKLLVQFCYISHDLTKDFIEASQQNSHQGDNIPMVVFVFFDGITKSVSGRSGYSYLVSIVIMCL